MRKLRLLKGKALSKLCLMGIMSRPNPTESPYPIHRIFPAHPYADTPTCQDCGGPCGHANVRCEDCAVSHRKETIAHRKSRKARETASYCRWGWVHGMSEESTFLCTGQNCRLRGECARYTAEPKHPQLWFNGWPEPCTGGPSCPFWRGVKHD